MSFSSVFLKMRNSEYVGIRRNDTFLCSLRHEKGVRNSEYVGIREKVILYVSV